MLYTVGDSHCMFSFSNIENVMAFHIGPITMHRVGRDGLGILNISGSEIPHGSRVICCFGEIDVRCHLAKYYSHDIEYSDEHPNGYTEETDPINVLVANYMKTILANREHHNVCVMSVIPPCRIKRMRHNASFPVKGADEQRVEYQRKLNTLLEERCKLSGVEFLNISDLYADEYGMLNPVYTRDGVHISNTAPMHRRLYELGWM